MSSSFQGDTITKCVNVESKRLDKNKTKNQQKTCFLTLLKSRMYI